MFKQVFKRLLAAVTLVFLVVSLVFALLVMAPGAPSDRYDDPRIPEQHREQLRTLYGYDQPLWKQYGKWLTSAVKGDWGYSHVYSRPVRDVIAKRLPLSLLLGATTLVVAVSTALLLGVATSRRENGPVDQGLRFVGLVVFSIPEFWLGLLAILVFSHTLHWLPSGGFRDPLTSTSGAPAVLIDRLRHLILPSFVLGLPLGVALGRYLRTGILEVQGSRYLVAAEARGLSPKRLLWRHTLKNAATPTLQVLSLVLPSLLGGAFLVEFIFSWPGLGTAALAGVQGRDYSLVLATTALSGTMVVVSTMVMDLLQGWLDPRVFSDRSRKAGRP